MNSEQKTAGQVAYEAYWKSVSNATTDQVWSDLGSESQYAWEASAKAVQSYTPTPMEAAA